MFVIGFFTVLVFLLCFGGLAFIIYCHHFDLIDRGVIERSTVGWVYILSLGSPVLYGLFFVVLLSLPIKDKKALARTSTRAKVVVVKGMLKDLFRFQRCRVNPRRVPW